MQIRIFLLSLLIFVPLATAQDERVPVPLIVRGDYVLTMDNNRPIIEDGAVVVVDDRIMRVGPWAEIEARYQKPSPTLKPH